MMVNAWKATGEQSSMFSPSRLHRRLFAPLSRRLCHTPASHVIANLLTFEPSTSQLLARTPRQPVCSIGDYVYVDDGHKLGELVQVLRGETEFAIDLEHFSNDSKVKLLPPDHTCLIQISTRTQDYIVDPFPLWRHLHALNDPMTNPDIVKVMHGGSNDVLWLQRDFGIHLVNLFDTHFAMLTLTPDGRHGLSHLVHRLTGVELSKSVGRSDWRQRPLSAEQIYYAQLDTHYLLYAFDVLTNELLADSNESLVDVYARSTAYCAKIYRRSQRIAEAKL